MGKIFYIMGKSASGKDKLYKQLVQRLSADLSPMVIYTTRPIRRDEEDGVTYHFTDREGFDRLKAAGQVIEERTYHTVQGDWTYFTAVTCFPELDRRSYLGIGTLESYAAIRKACGEETVVPLYIQVDDNIRLRRAIGREEKETRPDYKELCRRFLADSEDFSEDKLLSLGICHPISNNGEFADCLAAVEETIKSML